jgi:hypothetical protein
VVSRRWAGTRRAHGAAMRALAIAPALALLALASTAAAGPITAGVGVGRVQAEQDWDGEADGTLHAFGRLGLAQRVGAQLELQKIEGTYGTQVRTLTALLVVELGESGRLVPTMFGGFGTDRADDGYGYVQRGSHIEGGLGLEYRLDGGLVLMADVRLGGRKVDDDVRIYAEPTGTTALYAPALIEGEYRSLRAGVALRF